MGEQEQAPEHHGTEDFQHHDHPNTGGGHQIHTGDTTPIVVATTPRHGQPEVPTAATRMSFGAPGPPRTTWEIIAERANMAYNAPEAHAIGTGVPLDNRYGPIAEQGSGTNDRDSERLSFGSLSGASRTHSGARNNKGRDPIPLTPEILHLLDILEPDKGKQARLLTEHLTGQRSLPSTESELHTHMERRAARELKRQQVAAKAAANKATSN
jgi:hypothetical protein